MMVRTKETGKYANSEVSLADLHIFLAQAVTKVSGQKTHQLCDKNKQLQAIDVVT